MNLVFNRYSSFIKTCNCYIIEMLKTFRVIMKKLINLCCFINIDLTDPNIKKLTESYSAMKELVNIRLLGDYLVLLDLSTNIKYQLYIFRKLFKINFAVEDNSFFIFYLKCFDVISLDLGY
jgi:hypothetical protein